MYTSQEDENFEIKKKSESEIIQVVTSSMIVMTGVYSVVMRHIYI